MDDFLILTYFIAVIVWAFVWGFVTKTVNENKGYEGGFWWGFWLSWIGLIVVVCKPDNHVRSSSYNQGSSYAASRSSSKDTWRCAKCGTYNVGFSCRCGMLRGDSALLEKKQTEAKLEQVKKETEQKSDKTEIENIQKLKLYKELLDSGVITQEEFDKKKAELLKL